MSAEIWQFLIAAGLGATVALLWIIFVYRPRRTGEGEGSHTPSAKSDETSETDERE